MAQTTIKTMLKQTLTGCLLSLHVVMFSADVITLGVPENTGTSLTRLTWTRCGTSGETGYTILRHIENGSWQEIGTIFSGASSVVYVDTIYICDKVVSYRIEAFGGICTRSDSVSRPFMDTQGPESVSIDAISVNPETHEMEIRWRPSRSRYAYGYHIYEGAFAHSFAMVPGRESSSYLVQGQAADTSLRFSIAAVDSCGNGFRSSARRVFLCKAEQRSCEKKLEVSWRDAERSVSNIVRFEIMLARNDGDFELVDVVDDLSQRSAIVDVFGHLQNYRIYVRAVSEDETIYANSMVYSLTVVAAPEPEFAYIETLNVIHDETVEMRCHVDVDVVWQNLFAYIADTLVRTITYNEFRENNSILLPRKQAYYHFEISDTCGDIVRHSENTAKPILLEAELHENIVDMRFSAYQGWMPEEHIRYEIFEIRDGDTTLKSTLPSHADSWYIHQEFVANPEQILNLLYYVSARQGDGNPQGTRATAKSTTGATARSNVVEVIYRTEIPVHFPTGFMPDGLSKTYAPFYVPQPDDVMRFRIYNTFGQLVFSAKSPEEAWDGTLKGQPQPAGTYMYQFALTRRGYTTERQGTITLIR